MAEPATAAERAALRLLKVPVVAEIVPTLPNNFGTDHGL